MESEKMECKKNGNWFVFHFQRSMVCAWAQMFSISFYISSYGVFLVSSNLPPIIFMVETIFHKGIATRTMRKNELVRSSCLFSPRLLAIWLFCSEMKSTNLEMQTFMTAWNVKREKERWQRRRRQPEPFIKMDRSIRWHLKGQHLNRFGNSKPK